MKKQIFIFIVIFILLAFIGCSEKSRMQPLAPEVPEDTSTPLMSLTATETNTIDNTDTVTSTYTFTETQTMLNTPTQTETFTVTDTVTITGTPVNTVTETMTYTGTQTFTETDTETKTETFTTTQTETESETPTETQTVTETETVGETPTETATSTDNVTGTLTLPAAQDGKNYMVIFDDDANTGNGYTAQVTGVCGVSTDISYSVTVPDGTYYALAIVDVDGNGLLTFDYGTDYIGIYGVVFPAIPGSPNVVVSGNTVVDIELIAGSTGATNIFINNASVTQIRMNFMSMSMIITSVDIVLKENDALGNSLTGAAVSIGGVSIPESPAGSGEYIYSGTGYTFTPGSTVTFSINSTSGNLSQLITIPSNVSVSTPSDNAVLSTPSQNINWSYSGISPSSVNLMLYKDTDPSNLLLVEILPGATTSYSADTSSLVSGAHTLGVSALDLVIITDAAMGSSPLPLMNSYTVPVTAP